MALYRSMDHWDKCRVLVNGTVRVCGCVTYSLASARMMIEAVCAKIDQGVVGSDVGSLLVNEELRIAAKRRILHRQLS